MIIFVRLIVMSLRAVGDDLWLNFSFSDSYALCLPSSLQLLYVFCESYTGASSPLAYRRMPKFFVIKECSIVKLSPEKREIPTLADKHRSPALCIVSWPWAIFVTRNLLSMNGFTMKTSRCEIME